MAVTGTPRRLARVAPVLAVTLAIGSGVPVGHRTSPDVAEGGSIALACAAVYLIVCGPWAPICPSLPSACYASPGTIGP
jgi:hypothetical protein